MSEEKKARLNISVSEKTLNRLKKSTGIVKNQELMEQAILLLDWAVKERKEKHIVGSLDEKNQKYKEVVMPALSHG
ncbi:MAG: hypothetical protein ABUK01_11350 [Leptospirales bacterium]